MARGRKPGDHNARRIEIAEAACKTILRSGIANASLADIAREMGYTTGVLRHYFRDKEELLLFAKNTMFDRAHDRAVAAAESTVGTDRLRIMVVDTLKLDPETIDRWRLLAIFNGHAIGNSRLMALQQKRNERFWSFLEEEMLRLQQAGHLSARMDVALEARGLVAFGDGLADQIIMQPKIWSEAQLHTLVSNYLEGLLARCAPTGRAGARKR